MQWAFEVQLLLASALCSACACISFYGHGLLELEASGEQRPQGHTALTQHLWRQLQQQHNNWLHSFLQQQQQPQYNNVVLFRPASYVVKAEHKPDATSLCAANVCASSSKPGHHTRTSFFLSASNSALSFFLNSKKSA